MKTLSTAVKELLALHEMFRRLKFEAEELFVLSYLNGVQFQLVTYDKQVFTIDVPNPERISSPALVEEWSQAITWWCAPTTSDAERTAIIDGSAFWGQTVPLITKLTMRGLYPRTIKAKA